MKRLIKVLAILCLVCGFIASIVFYGTEIAIKNIMIENKTIESNKINEDINLKIAYISDIHYNHFMNKDRLEKMIEKINNNKPDIILFGGDVFDKPSKYPIDEKTENEIIELLQSLHAEYGKFAVLGEEDYDPQVNDIHQILFKGDFEVLTNKQIFITKDGKNMINLIGIDSLVGGNPDIESSFANVDTNLFTIVLTHAPDIISQLPTNEIDLVLAGHSHGGQINIPFIGSLTKVEGAKNYSQGDYYINQTQLIVSNGLGTTETDIRIFADPECHMIRITKQQTK